MKYHTNNKILLLCEQTKRGIKKVEVSEEEVKLFIEEYFSQSIKPKEIEEISYLIPTKKKILQLSYGKGESVRIDKKYSQRLNYK